MVESERWIPSRSSKADCNRSKVQSSKGYPRVRGFWKARLTSLPRVSSLCTRGWPGLGLSSSPTRPSWLNRLTHSCPEKSVLYPASRPACAAETLGSSSMAWITLARCTRGTGAVRDRTNRAISSLSSWDSSRKRNFLGISSSHNLPTMGVVIPYLLAETTTKSLGEQRMDLTHVMATLLQLKEEELTHRVGSFYSDHCLVPLQYSSNLFTA